MTRTVRNPGRKIHTYCLSCGYGGPSTGTASDSVPSVGMDTSVILWLPEAQTNPESNLFSCTLCVNSGLLRWASSEHWNEAELLTFVPVS
ncbi:hypothetical protein SCLCIDRAFT_1224914 [Scleroderma citrinum Foug A]|uniref:Uncharacterized protein n=1 Tax=Scleroderma citrinum Foug A TaxID=1036808 RepID=A0A0C3D3L9_9AGAM|nr:hypothetical protein SCLCIDRAFT_1224914 [Scleroderma citrinum Foug A]